MVDAVALSTERNLGIVIKRIGAVADGPIDVLVR